MSSVNVEVGHKIHEELLGAVRCNGSMAPAAPSGIPLFPDGPLVAPDQVLAAMAEYLGAIRDLAERVEYGSITYTNLQSALEAATIAADEILKALKEAMRVNAIALPESP
jgi:hypothetical protein